MEKNKQHHFTIKDWGIGLLLACAVVGLLYAILGLGISVSYSIKGLLIIGELSVLSWAANRLGVWREFGIFLLLYTLIMGFLGEVPHLNIVNESIRNLYFHVCMWFSMIFLLIGSFYQAILFLKTGKLEHDIRSSEYTYMAILYGTLGIITGMIWAQFTWGKFWHGDPKQVATAIGLLMYFAYSILRGSFQDDSQRAKISAIYAIFCFPIFLVLIFVLPRMTPDSLHPGVGGNPGFGKYDLDDHMRLVFYPAILSWTILGAWIATIRIKTRLLYAQKNDII